MKELADAGFLDDNVLTVTGKTLGENVAHAENRDPEIIRPLSNPYSATGGLAFLFGNIAKNGCVVKRSARGAGDAGPLLHGAGVQQRGRGG